jgi:uncharacterized protein YybS (DUF2232 family)
VSRPRTIREWWWLAGSGLWLVLSLARSGGIADQTVMALGVLITGTFLVVTLRGRRSFFAMALLAVALALPILVLWAWHFHIGWDDLRLAVAREGRELRESIRALPSGSVADSAAVSPYVDALTAGIESAAVLFPGLLVLTALLGLAVAWNWYHRIAARPFGVPASPLRQFRFSDHLVWGAVVGLALAVLPLPPPAAAVGANLLLVFGGLYALRGAAVLRSLAGTLPPVAWLLLGLVMIFLLPVALGVLVSLGLADTWVDFRRRLAVPPRGE